MSAPVTASGIPPYQTDDDDDEEERRNGHLPQTDVTGGFTARRTRISGAVCARQLQRRAVVVMVVVGQGGLQRRCRGAVGRAAQQARAAAMRRAL